MLFEDRRKCHELLDFTYCKRAFIECKITSFGEVLYQTLVLCRGSAPNPRLYLHSLL